MAPQSNITIAEFYANKSVLLTGATGFIGRVLLEKILRGCPDVSKVYVLVRGDKRGNTGEKRINNIMKAPLFQLVRENNPEMLKKVVPVNGDVIFEDLGIDLETTQVLRKEVSVVIHSAANVNFSQGLKNPVQINVAGTRNMLRWSKKLENLKAFVYISSAFSNAYLLNIEEKVYHASISPDALINLCSELPADLVESLAPTLRGKHELNYTFTKQMAEMVVEEYKSQLPVLIVRPAIVGQAYNEPFQGWIDNYTGFVGVLANMARGLVRVVCTNKGKTLDIVPVDYVVNLTIASALCIAQGLMEADLLVFNCSVSDKPYVNGVHGILEEARETPPFNKIYLYPNITIVTNMTVFRILDYLLHYVPAVLLDSILKLVGKQQRVSVVDTYNKLSKLGDLVLKTTTKDLSYNTRNMKTLYELLTPIDKEKFCFNFPGIKQDEYIKRCVIGFRRYTVGAKDEDIPAARAHMKRHQMYYNGFWIILLSILAIVFGIFAGFFKTSV